MIIWSVYIITNKPNGVLYIGVTKDLKRRIHQHRNKIHPRAFSARYNLEKLMYYENYKTKEETYTREKQMKKWNREWKIKLIEKDNISWIDLTENLTEYFKNNAHNDTTIRKYKHRKSGRNY